MWVEVKTFGDRVMFVTRDYCFFTPASEFYTCNLNNCIVFSNDAFPKYGRTGWELPDPTKSGADISVFRLGGCSEYNFKPISKFTGFPLLLWSCPPWAWNVGSSPCQCHGQQSQHQRETEENEEIQSDANSQDDASPVSFDPEPVENISEATSTSTTRLETATVMMPSSFESELAEKTTEMPSTPATKERATIVETPSAVVPQLAELITTEMPSTSATPERVTSAETPSAVIPEQMHEVPITSAAKMTKSNTPDLAKQVSVKASVSAAQEGATTLTNEVEPVAEEAFHMETLREEIINQSGSRANIQSNKTDTSTVTFEGLEIRSNLLPTLQNVWSKHGNLMENITIRNVDIVSKALESLATAVLILEENSARSLSDSQADYLSSTLSDLGCMKFKVDWLVPYVEKAAMLHNSKPYMDSLDIIDKCKAQIEERKSKLLEELAHLDKVVDELDEDVARVSKEIPICISENVDLAKPLGGSNQSDNSTIKFEGLEIRSTLFPTLQKVWSKHGNLIENITIRNGDIVSRALESLATAVIILEENPVCTLTDSQADYLSSTLSDLRSMQFKVDWLVPFVEKAVKLHKSKQLMDSLDKLGHCKAQIAEKKSKLLEEVAALDKLADELEEEIAGVSKVVSFYGNVDFGKPVGGGLS
uniref:Uncharacterized protein n=1 Tax=Chenopodium quinoa TaxID=63459 RepID=A0A803L893_CHEQI